MALRIEANVAGLPVASKVLEMLNQTLAQAEEVFKGVAEEVGERVIDRTPVDTGRARGNWQTTLNHVPNQALIRYDKEGTSAKRELKDTINEAKSTDKILITNQVNYSPELEFGSSKQAPEGMVRVTVGELEGIVEKVIHKVKSKN